MGAKVFHLDKFKQAWAQFKDAKRREREAKSFTKEAGELFKELSGGADEFYMGGQKVATVVPGQLNLKKLMAEQPELVAECTELQTTQVFNKVRFAKEYPEIFEKYRAQRLVLIGDPEEE